MIYRVRYWLASLLRRRRRERELDEEVRDHIDRETRRNVERGMPAPEARRVALVAFGGRERLKEAHRDQSGTRWLFDFAADARHGVRVLMANPALSVAAVATLALGVGANTAIFTAVSASLLRPLPFEEPDRLVMVGENNREFVWHMADAAPANYLDWRHRVLAFQDAMAYADGLSSTTLLVNGAPELAPTAAVTGNFFSVLGVGVQLGRTFRDDETWNDAPPVVILSDRLWRERFRASRSIVGTSISVNGDMAEVIGVAKAGFAFPLPDVALWAPFAWKKEGVGLDSFRRAHWLKVVARLRHGVSAEEASAQLTTVANALKREYPATNRIMEAELAPLQRFLVGDARLPLLVLLGAVTLLLLIACVNVGNLLLVRAANREREVAVRAALGAGRWRLARQALAESLVLSFAGGGAGLLLGWWGTRVLVRLEPRTSALLPNADPGMDWRVALYALVLTIGTGIVFGIAPAVWASRRSPNDVLSGSARSTTRGVRARRVGERLAAIEVAIALALTVGAVLLVRSYQNLQNVNPGFDASNVLTVKLQLPFTRYDSSSKVRRFVDAVVSRVRATPGVADVGATTQLPMTQPGWSSDFSIEGASAGRFGATLLHRDMTPDYHRTMRVPIIRGRGFTESDRGPPYVVVINQAFAREYFKGQDPIGQRITFTRRPDSTTAWRTIVGVVGDEHQSTPGTPVAIEVDAPFSQEVSWQICFVVRTVGEPSSLAPAMRRAIADVDRLLAIQSDEPMEAIRAASMARDRFIMTLLSMFGFVGLGLAAVGVYGVVAQLARARRREMGIRIALGAHTREVEWLIVRRGLAIALLGVAAGCVLSLASAGAMRKLVFGLLPSDPPTLAAAAAIILAATLAASWLPAFRLGRVDPVTVLRED